MSRHVRGAAVGFLCCQIAACAEPAAEVASGQDACPTAAPAVELPTSIDESSGVAISRANPGIRWTHNDSGGEPEIYAIDEQGRLVGTVRVPGAENRDWEDIALAPCATGDCIYIADIGDNAGRRAEVVVYRVPEPDPSAEATETAERFAFRYSDGARDAEALFVLPERGLYVVSKGRGGPVNLYSYTGELVEGRPLELVRVRSLTGGPVPGPDQVTGADATTDGRWVAIRTYAALLLYAAEELLAATDPRPRNVRLDAASGGQGEGVALADDGTVVLTTEALGRSVPGVMVTLRCDLP